ncbi:MAG TPA: lipase maturation factor family protein, partial [Kofleriaceae bacterium]|nr:lipase maturation factor family protein [Kofleriaceae bacterium]
GDPARRPAFTGPHMPRLDWQMWFAALFGCRGAPWFVALEARLLEGRPEVRELLARDPFGDDPPRYLRSTLHEYRFTGPGDDGWWTRREIGRFCPPVRRR